jgi:hypothetical protein
MAPTLWNTAAGSIFELGVLTSQCFDRRIPNKQILIDKIAVCEHDLNANTGNSPPKMLASNLSTYILQSA